jgi:hypothetical protein
MTVTVGRAPVAPARAFEVEWGAVTSQLKISALLSMREQTATESEVGR